MSGSVSEHHFSQRDKKPREHPIVMKKRYQIGPGAAESLEIGWPEPSGNVSIFFSLLEHISCSLVWNRLGAGKLTYTV